MLGDEPGAGQHLLEVALGQSLTLRHHAEPVRARRLGGASVLEDLVGLHHRVQRRVGLGVAGLSAKAAVLGAPTRLGVHQRTEIGGVGKALDAHAPGAVDQLPDLDRILEFAEA